MKKYYLAWVTVPAFRPGTRQDPFGVSVRGRLVGGVRQWDPYPGNWVRGVGPHAINSCTAATSLPLLLPGARFKRTTSPPLRAAVGPACFWSLCNG